MLVRFITAFSLFLIAANACNRTVTEPASCNPNATEVCDDMDNNCNGMVDYDDPQLVGKFFAPDVDRDGYVTAGGVMGMCGIDGLKEMVWMLGANINDWVEVPYRSDGSIMLDCDDNNAAVYPGHGC